MFAPLVAVGGALLAFHVWLLGQQAWSGQLQSAASMRWLLAIGVVGGLIALHRRGVSLGGRRATALWVLAALLHGPTIEGDHGPAAQLLAETSNAAIQIAGAALGLAVALSLGRVARSWQPPPDRRATAIGPACESRLGRADLGDLFLPRPPPRG